MGKIVLLLGGWEHKCSIIPAKSENSPRKYDMHINLFERILKSALWETIRKHGGWLGTCSFWHTSHYVYIKVCTTEIAYRNC